MTVTRFAPSPTGYLHVGNLRTALFNALIAARAGGTFLLRLDDTDRERSRPEYAAAIEEDLRWLGLDWARIERQSDRLDRYAVAAERLRASGRLYEAFETPEELEVKRRIARAAGRPPVYDRAALALAPAEKDRLRAERGGHWRFRLDRERVEWADGILGPVSIDAGSVSDPVLIRGDGQVLYTFASAVDDLEMGITDVTRGADHVTNTAAQIQIIAALGGTPPCFAHHSLLTGPEGEALSKRLGSLALRDLRAAGTEPLALLSLLARLGSSDPVEPRASLAEIAAGFDLARFGAAPTKFDPAELVALGARTLRSLDLAAVSGDLAALGVPEAERGAFWEAVRGNVATRAELSGWWRICREGPAAPPPAEEAAFLAEARALLPERPWDGGTWAAWTGAVKAATGRGGRALFQPLRRWLTGLDHGPEMARLMPLLRVTPPADG
ncbi:glutamate--tRNA ligase [Amaricoccus solimangrovi]|uniref:Glutamate--tRNA ligase n=1 Tax=Amaricoccus solimangrovi TaxID=2589815 RepID=A0A501WUG3_9RHOB|nr:glutamate--tRNA ligase [Amaricoccus solimangrovi]TPE52939.1 glutamate--tRNA ligase [Amaricoccus solimangrovi]